MDGLSGEELMPSLVRAARAGEMEVFKARQVYKKVPIDECIKITDKRPIGTRWVDVAKGDSTEPEYRSRLVAKEIKREACDEYFVATPTLESKKALFALAMSDLAKRRGATLGDAQKKLSIDVRRAYFYALSQRVVYVALPNEDANPGMCGKMVKAMYETRDAAVNPLDSFGFVTGRSPS